MAVRKIVFARCNYLFCCTFLLFNIFAGISGCASKLNEIDSNSSEIMTESDEPETRRRARIRLELAVGYFEQGQTTIALDELKQSLAIDPNHGEAYSLRGLIYMQLKNLKFSEESFKQALTLSPLNSNIMHNLGWLLCQQARYPEAKEFFIQTLSNV